MTRTILKTLSLAVVMAATAAFAQANAMNREGANLGTSACTRARWLGMLALRFLFLGLALSECEIANGAGRLAKIAGLFRSADNSGQPDPAALQTELQRYADDFLNKTTAGMDHYARTVGTTEARNQAAVWKLSVGSSVMSIVSGPNPTSNLVELVALATITRTVLEEVWVKTEQGKAFQPWLKDSRTLEANAWKIADGILTVDQQQELRGIIAQWSKSNAGSNPRKCC